MNACDGERGWSDEVPVLLPASLPACLPVGRQVWRHVCEGDDGRLRILGWREMSGEGCAVRHCYRGPVHLRV